MEKNNNSLLNEDTSGQKLIQNLETLKNKIKMKIQQIQPHGTQ